MQSYTAFELQIAALFRDAGATSVEHDVRLGGHQIDVLVSCEVYGRTIHIAIECKKYSTRPVGINEATQFSVVVTDLRAHGLIDWGIIVSKMGFTRDARQLQAVKTSSLLLFTPDDIPAFYMTLGAAQFPINQYFVLLQDYLNTFGSVFVPNRAIRQPSREVVPSLQAELTTIVDNAEPSLTFVFGGTGSGKSTTLRQLASSQIRRLQASEDTAVPLLVELGAYRGIRDCRLHDFVADRLRKDYPMISASWPQLKPKLDSGRFILLLDGFDEIRNMSDSNSVFRTFRHFLEVLGPKSKCFISCRSGVANTPIFSREGIADQVQSYSKDINANAFEILPFRESEIRGFLTLSSRQEISQHSSFPSWIDLLSRPLLLKMIADWMPVEAASTLPHSEEEVIDVVLNHMLNYRPDLLTETSDSVSPSEWREFLEFCAFRMYLENTRLLWGSDLSSCLANFPRFQALKDKLEHFIWDIKVRSVFDVVGEGIQFSHTVFRDFLAGHELARKLLATDEHANAEAVPEVELSGEQLRFVRYAVQKVSEITSRKSGGPFQTDEKTKTLRLHWIPPGPSIVSYGDLTRNRPGRVVNFKNGYWISETPVIAEECAQAMRSLGNPLPTLLRRVEQMPRGSFVSDVTHSEAQDICNVIYGGRLPTEPEWERAAGWIDGSFPRNENVPEGSRWLSHARIGHVMGNPWKVRGATGWIWQWTSSKDTKSGTYICKGAWWGADHADKLDAWIRLIPSKPTRTRTGFRVVIEGLAENDQ
jgi:hypothetical protein